MARLYTAAAASAALLAVLAWHQAKFASLILFAQPLPASYFAYGDASKQCNVIRDPANELGFCEDVISWGLEDAHGRPRRAQRLLLSCDMNRLAWNTVMGPLRDPNPRGALWVHDYTPGGAGLHKLELLNYPVTADFHPLGVSVFTPPEGTEHTLFVVNHGRYNSTVEVFRLAEDAPFAATHVRTLSSPRFVSPNAVAATSASSFYVSQDHTFTRRLRAPFGNIIPPLETILGLPLGWVDHVSFSSSGSALHVSRAASRIPFANGISLDNSGTQLAVASSSVGRVYLYTRSPPSNVLVHDSTIHLPFAPDNLGFDDGRLIVGGHPTLPHLIARARNTTGVTPGSWIVSVEPRTSAQDDVDEMLLTPLPVLKRMTPHEKYLIRTLYQSNGSESGGGWQTATSAVLDEEHGEFFVAGLYAPGILRCTTR
ncbi:hypothetical protein EXIGLDRAFT_744295 [Exidia glandulosa HHB12029]|uniref:Calcium-dependent phosphotriesterase n=1 Tax=Exidia glandulosa HHB12029 TaxID=1314781 RepID=A0A166BNM0_EXIGL|nr:hypothetical protein EXIGLDRAFT_744295 [Exidia glandulosa HHB12029]